jgi:hypothetical protein
MRYFAAHGDVNALIEIMLQWSRLPMHRPLLNVAAGCATRLKALLGGFDCFGARRAHSDIGLAFVAAGASPDGSSLQR